MFLINVPILEYHQINPTDPRKDLIHALSVNKFKAQMRYLYKKGYTCLSLVELLQKTPHQQSKLKKSFALTFDDGYKNFFTQAFPVLRSYGFTATVFLITDRIHQQDGLEHQRDGKYLNWEQIETLQRLGISFGSHTCTHPNLLDLSREEIWRELAVSKSHLETRLGKEVQWLAYPHGATSDEIQKIAEAVGYKAALGTHCGRRNLFNIWRCECFRDDALISFAFKLFPWYLYPRILREETNVGRTLGNLKSRIAWKGLT